MNYVAYFPNGRIFQSGSCQDDWLEHQGPSDTIKMEVPRPVDPNAFYVVDGTLVALPPKPSEHHRFSYTTKQWEDPRSIDDLRAEKWRNIKFNRDQAERGGFTWDGSKFDSDQTSQQRIAVAVQMAQMNPAFTTVWTLADNTRRTLNAKEFFEVGRALGAHVSGIFTHAQALREQIEQACTAQEVEAIHW